MSPQSLFANPLYRSAKSIITAAGAPQNWRPRDPNQKAWSSAQASQCIVTIDLFRPPDAKSDRGRGLIIRSSKSPTVGLVSRRSVDFLRSPHVAAQLLARWKGDPAAMADLRLLLHESSRHAGVDRLKDDDILAEVGRLMHAGELLLVEFGPLHITPGGAGAMAQAATQQPTQAPPPKGAPSQEDEPEPATFGSDLDGAAQAATLQAAAAQGAPFCPT